LPSYNSVKDVQPGSPTEDVGLDAGKRIRALRERLGLTVRDVEAASARIAEKRNNRSFFLPLSRLFEIENKDVVPSAYRFYSLAVIFRRDIRELLGWYGIDVDEMGNEIGVVDVPFSHPAAVTSFATKAKIPVAMSPAFDPVRTTNLGQAIAEWGFVPLTYLSQFSSRKFSYGYVGAEDFTMHPILSPGAFVQIDESKDKVVEGKWQSEYHRPIYFIETREGYRCSWCSLQDGSLTLQPHPLSPEPLRTYRYPQDVEVIGQVVGIAMRLHDPTKPKSK
jgi:transcriptional regulator with XRE-family HTH domain